MKRSTKVGLVCSGYLLAFVSAGVAGYLYDLQVSASPGDTSGGMYAAGATMAALGAFLVVAAVPTMLALWFLRRNRTLWHVIAAGSLGFASLGLLAVLMPLAVHDAARHPALLLLDLLGLAQLLGVPLWTLCFVLFAFIAPAGAPRRLLVAAVGLELVIGICAAIHWLAPPKS